MADLIDLSNSKVRTRVFQNYIWDLARQFVQLLDRKELAGHQGLFAFPTAYRGNRERRLLKDLDSSAKSKHLC